MTPNEYADGTVSTVSDHSEMVSPDEHYSPTNRPLLSNGPDNIATPLA